MKIFRNPTNEPILLLTEEELLTIKRRLKKEPVYAPDAQYLLNIIDEEKSSKAKERKVLISTDEYIKLTKTSRYVSRWDNRPRYECKRCGELNPEGYLCHNCGMDNSTPLHFTRDKAKVRVPEQLRTI